MFEALMYIIKLTSLGYFLFCFFSSNE